MWSTLAVLTLICLAGVVFGGCPIMQKSYEYGRKHFASVSNRQTDLVNEGFILSEGPGSFFWGGPGLELVESELVNRSSVLIFASQFYTELSLEQQFQKLTIAQKLDNLKNMSECLPTSARCTNITGSCDPNARFQNMNGTCSNLDNPLWSSQNSPYFRVGEPSYSDGIHQMPKSYLTNDELPPARFVGNTALNSIPYTEYPTKLANYGGLIYGQFITHDLSKRNPYQNYLGGPGLRCCSQDAANELPEHLLPFGCAAITIPSDDPILPFYNVTCLDMIRSQTTLPNDCNMGVAQKQNLVTGVLDVSNVYGSSDSQLAPLRSFIGGKLAIVNGVLPLKPNCTDGNCYNNGDSLALLQPTLALMHSLFYRLHNSIADKLALAHQTWDDERLFQESRRIIIAVHQHFTYNEWLPLFLGESYSVQSNLTCTDSLYCGEYNPTLDPSPSHAFSQGAFRLYHAFIPDFFDTYDSDYSILSSTNISQSVINLNVLNTQYEDYLRGYMLTPITFDMYSYTLRNNIFHPVDNPIGIDLLSNDIIVGRDHGILPYYVFKDQVLGTTSTEWSDLEDTISPENIEVLQTLYESMQDLDLYVGMSLENRSVDYLGTVAKYIVANQFNRSKFGNRFFYTFKKGPYAFTSPQLTEIKRYTLANLYCEVTNITEVQPRAMEVPNDEDNSLISCENYKPLDISLFV